ncbi:PREDICTED: uncharacterized protein LOC107187789 [Dufourea novaeangliae]|uniref:uncharacterized protein LOC107187789 n=1 Tax=Dufourea novaeangliae TaxID=178035 RepID=UPI00076722C3|nr:PREDICTED: uncharacterized protein LOC107187789 [Dufourea novaeangliae]
MRFKSTAPSSVMSKSKLQLPIPSEQSDGKVGTRGNSPQSLLTFQDVQNVAKRSLGREVDVKKFALRPYSSGTLGFLGTHLRLTVEVESKSGGTETLSFFVKGVPYDVPVQAEYVIDRCVFLKEKIFYRDIVPEFYKVYNKEPWSPTCYLVKDHLLIFEDLGAKGYTVSNKVFTKERVVAGLTTLARLHASSLLTEARLGVSLKKLYPHGFVENSFSQTGKCRQWFSVGIDAIVGVAEHIGLDASLLPNICEEVFSGIETSATKRNVVSHGDLWGNNLMYSNDVPPKCLLVDFQLVRYCPLAHDVAQFLYLSADRSFRLACEESMLKHYYSVLCDTLKTAKISVDIPAWSEVVEGMEEQRLCAAITAATFFQTVLLDEQVGAEITNDSDTYSIHQFVSRTEMIINTMKSTPEYNRRLTEIVTELVELSFRFDELPKPS